MIFSRNLLVLLYILCCICPLHAIEVARPDSLVFSWNHFVTDRDWARVTSTTLHRNLSGGWVWDNDSFSGNQFSHPYHGSMFYNAAREHGLSYGVSLLYPVAGSVTWELLCETNRPAINDLLSTGVGGAAFGEVTHRMSDIFFDFFRQHQARSPTCCPRNHRFASQPRSRHPPHHVGRDVPRQPFQCREERGAHALHLPNWYRRTLHL